MSSARLSKHSTRASSLVRPIPPVLTRTIMSSAASILVTPPANASITREKQDHWKGEAASSGFFNPWKSAAPKPAFWPMFKFVRELNSMSANDPDVQNIASLVPWQKPDFGATLPHDQLKLTWLSHASFLAQMPSKGPSPKERGVNILFDPAYSKRCSPSQYFGGNVRMQPPPATPEELPEVDMVMISHNHYDHCDINTLQAIFSKNQERPPLLFVGLNGAANLRSTVGASTQIIEMDWWETREVDVAGRGKVKVHCTPCQHTCQRSLFDLDKSLWASWAVQEVKEDGQIGASIWHAGDTGYCHVNEETHTIDPSLPTCPAFKEIGQKYGPFTATMIPIGAYAPRHLMSTNHNAPIDAVRMFKDVQAKNAIAMHWGTWRMAHDRVAEPPEKLVDARKEVGLQDDEFIVVGLGETKGYEV